MLVPLLPLKLVLEFVDTIGVLNKLEDLDTGIYIWHMVTTNSFLFLGLTEISWLKF